MSDFETFNERLTPRQRKAVAALAAGNAPAQAAEAAGCARATIYRWLDDPDFVSELATLQGAMMKSTARALGALARGACIVLAEGMQKREPMTTRLRAANLILENALAWGDLQGLVERIERLERQEDRET